MTKQQINRNEDYCNIEEYCILENGSFKIVYSDGTIYEGEFKNDVKEGKGKMIYPNGTIYEGEFKNDMLNGNLTIYTTEGKEKKIFIGTINKNQELTGVFNGKYESGNEYTGELVNNLKEGNGTYKDEDGKNYEGEFKNDMFNGSGKLTCTETFKNGEFFYTEIYEGEFKNNMFNGPGKLTRAGVYNGHNFEEKYEGYWSDNELYSKNSIYINRLIREKRELESEIQELKKESYTNSIPPVSYYTGKF